MSDKVQKIKEEIKRLKHTDIAYDRSRFMLLLQIEDFIDSLPEEFSTKVLEEEATRFVKTKEFYKSEESPVILIARHFAEWQKQQMKEALQTEYEKGRFDAMQNIEVWNDEDKNHITNIILLLEEFLQPGFPIFKAGISEEITWLNSLIIKND